MGAQSDRRRAGVGSWQTPAPIHRDPESRNKRGRSSASRSSRLKHRENARRILVRARQSLSRLRRSISRAQEYALISALLARAPDAELLHRLAQLPGDPSPLGRAHADLAQAAGRTHAAAVDREYFDLFVGLGRGELLPYASFYLTGFLQGHPPARLRRDLAEVGPLRSPAIAEPEDHAAILCELMSGLARRQWPAPPGAEREIFEVHLAPWIGHFSADLERADAGQFYRSVGALGRVYMDIEVEAFALPA
jgi:TorA maturation chaperone TorD